MGRNPPTCSKEISIAQAETMHEQLRPMVRYLGKLVERMQNDLRFPPNDRLLVAANNAYHASRDLLADAHSLTVRMGASKTGPM